MHGVWLLVCALFVRAVAAGLFAPRGPVLQVTPANFEREVLRIEKPTMVAFTAPWCGYCKQLAPEYTRVASELDGVIKITYVDCDDAASEPLCRQYGVQGFPTIKLFPATKKRLPRDYLGERKARAMIEYAVDSLPAEVVRRVDADLDSFLAQGTRPKVVLVSSNPKSTPMYRALALDFRGRVPFAYMYAGKSGVLEAAAPLDAALSKETLPALFFVGSSVHRYTGPMRYRQIHMWIDELSESASGKSRRGAEADATSTRPYAQSSAEGSTKVMSKVKQRKPRAKSESVSDSHSDPPSSAASAATEATAPSQAERISSIVTAEAKQAQAMQTEEAASSAAPTDRAAKLAEARAAMAEAAEEQYNAIRGQPAMERAKADADAQASSSRTAQSKSTDTATGVASPHRSSTTATTSHSLSGTLLTASQSHSTLQSSAPDARAASAASQHRSSAHASMPHGTASTSTSRSHSVAHSLPSADASAGIWHSTSSMSVESSEMSSDESSDSTPESDATMPAMESAPAMESDASTPPTTPPPSTAPSMPTETSTAPAASTRAYRRRPWHEDVDEPVSEARAAPAAASAEAPEPHADPRGMADESLLAMLKELAGGGEWNDVMQQALTRAQREAEEVLADPTRAKQAVREAASDVRSVLEHDLSLLEPQLRTKADAAGQPLAPETVADLERQHRITTEMLRVMDQRQRAVIHDEL